MQQWEKIPFVGIKLCTGAQRGFLFFLRTHFTAFCKINKYFIWYQWLSLAAFLLVVIFTEVFLAALAPFAGQGDPGDRAGGGCPLPIKPRGAALGSVLSVPLAAAPSQRGQPGRRWPLCHTGATCPELEVWLYLRGYLGSTAQICLCHGHVCTEPV